MSDRSETGGRPLPISTQHLESSNSNSNTHRRNRRTSLSSDERIDGTKSTSSQRRQSARKEATLGPQTGSSRGNNSTMQRSISPTQMSPESVHYTRTGRISKAKKGLKVHNCECGRSYTRAEHLRRHQKNHATDAALRCDFPGCGKPFYRIDLLQRHQERHNEVGNDSPQASAFSPRSTAEPEASMPVSASMATPLLSAAPQPPAYYPPVSPMPESVTEARYKSSPFRTPRIPSLAFDSTPRSSPISKSSPGFNQGKQRASFAARPTSVAAASTIPMGVNELSANSVAWTEPFSHSPYSSSSGYASPIPHTGGDYANMFANPPYGPGSNRTRTSSNASFVEPSWSYPSQSPTSATSTMAYGWNATEKGPATSHLAYLAATSYPMTSMPMSAGVDPMNGYGDFGSKTMTQRDQEEQEFLFPEQSYGMGQIAHTYPYEQYLNNFWRHFHAAFPVVHRATYERVTQSPMLHAAVIAIGGQYSNDASVKRKSRILHDRCMKLLDKRDLEVVNEPERLCDWQALFLIEVLSQFRARRAAKTLSSRFETMYHKFCESFRMVASNISENLASLAQPENVTYSRWTQWIDLSTRQQLLLCCYILETQQATLLARSPQQPIIHFTGFDLPFPSHSALWDATTPSDWAMQARQHAQLPTYVYEVQPELMGSNFDAFQSSLLIAANYNLLSNPAPYLSPPAFASIDHLVDTSATTRHNLLTAKLLQVMPVRALLAVSGESWILSEKVPSQQAFSSYKMTLRTWIAGLWTDSSDPNIPQPAQYALKIAIEILQHAMAVPNHSLRLEMGPDMGLYYSALIIWAVTVSSSSRINSLSQSQPSHQYHPNSPLQSSFPPPTTPTLLTINHLPPTPGTSPISHQPETLHHLPPNQMSILPTIPSSASDLALPMTHSMLPHSEIIISAMNFLTSALMEMDYLGIAPQWPRDVTQWQQGCCVLMRWVKMRLRNACAEGNDAGEASVLVGGRGIAGDGCGELLDGTIAGLEKILGRGWEGWGV